MLESPAAPTEQGLGFRQSYWMFDFESLEEVDPSVASHLKLDMTRLELDGTNLR